MMRSIVVVGIFCAAPSIRAAAAFVMQHRHQAATTNHLQRFSAIPLRSGCDDDDDDAAAAATTTNDDISLDNQRRKLLTYAPSIYTLPFLFLGDTASAAEVTNAVASPTSVESVEQTNVVSISSPSSSSSSRILCADSEEENRIAIFERVAPSVVYIDTFSEKRDVFSTNVMEVPIGSGSGKLLCMTCLVPSLFFALMTWGLISFHFNVMLLHCIQQTRLHLG